MLKKNRTYKKFQKSISYNKTIEPEKNAKLMTVGPTSIPGSRVGNQ